MLPQIVKVFNFHLRLKISRGGLLGMSYQSKRSPKRLPRT